MVWQATIHFRSLILMHIRVQYSKTNMYTAEADMQFYTIRELRTTPKALWERLAQDGEVVITNNGRPSALMINIADGSFEETVRAVRQAKAMIAFNAMRMQAAKQGHFTDTDIEAEIRAVREQKKE